MSTEYSVFTPYGTFSAVWPEDEDQPVSYSGNADAIAYFKDFLDMAMVTGAGGRRLSMESLEPIDLSGFCQSKDYGILVTGDFGDDDELADSALDSALDAAYSSPLEEAMSIISRLNEGDEDRDGLCDRLAYLIPLVEIADADELAAFQEAAAQAVGSV